MRRRPRFTALRAGAILCSALAVARAAGAQQYDRPMPLCRDDITSSVSVGDLDSVGDVPDTLEARVAWLREHAVPLRTIDPAEGDFSDLAPLAEALGQARIVLLGEQSHADGATFVAKDRLVRFLHRELGFGVLAFEAHHEALHVLDARLRHGASIDSIRGLLPGMWGDSEYVRELLRYARDTWRSGAPLRVAGFDLQLSRRPPILELSRRALRELVDDLTTGVPGRGRVALSEEESLAVGQALLHVDSILRPDGILARDPADVGHEGYARALRDVRRLEGRVSALLGGREREAGARLLRLLRNVSWVLRDLEHRQRTGDERWTAVRDEAMAGNLAWLAERAVAGQRIVAWAHSGHIARKLGGIRVLDGSFSWEGEVPMGEHLAARFGRDVYAIGFLAYEGERGQVFPDTAFRNEIPEPPPGSLDWLLGQVGEPYLFLDLRSVPADHWLRSELVARPVYRDMEAVWPEVYDGFIFTRRMFPNRRVTPLAERAPPDPH